MRRIAVVGGGVAGVETALTLARGLHDAQVTLLTHRPQLHLHPDLVYVPFGAPARQIDLALDRLLVGSGVTARIAEVEAVDVVNREIRWGGGRLGFDVAVVAPGSQPLPTGAPQLRTLEHAVELRRGLRGLLTRAEQEAARMSVVVRASADDAWGPPAYEFAALVATHLVARGLRSRVSVTLATAEMSPFQWFDPEVAEVVERELQALGVELAVGVPEGRFDDIAGDLVVDFGQLAARHVTGVPGRDERGWYATDTDGRVHECVHVVGDAARTGFKAAFAVAWQARRVLLALGGDLRDLGRVPSGLVAGVPVDHVEYHMDLGRRTLCVRMPVAASIADPWLGHDAEVRVEAAPADRFAGLLLGSVVDGLQCPRASVEHRTRLEHDIGQAASR